MWADVNRRTLLVGSLAAILGPMAARFDHAVPLAEGEAAAPLLDDPYGFASTLTKGWPGVRTSRPVPDYGVDWHVLLPGGRSLTGSSAAVQIHEVKSAEGRIVAALDDPRRTEDFLRGPGRRLLVAADTSGDTTRHFLLQAPDARDLPAVARGGWQLPVPDAYELDDLTYGILWAVANLDDALQTDDQALAEARADLKAYEQLSASAVSREAAPGLNPVGHMWLGSDFCARHILRSLPQLPAVPTFWTREQRGEEASAWLLFDHKYTYLQQTMRLIGSPVVRAFCIPESAVRDSARAERTLLFLAIALMESLGIRTHVTTDPEYGAVEGFVIAPNQQAIIANWVRADGMWHVDTTSRAGVVRGFTEVAADVAASSIVDGPTPALRLRSLAHYLDLEWSWITRRCAGLAIAGTAGMMKPRSRMISSAGLDAACTFVGSLPANG